MEQGHFSRHLSKMRTVYAERRAWLVDALAATLGEQLQVQPQAGGIQVLTYLNTRRNDKTLTTAAEAKGLAVQALSDWRMRKSSQGGLLMGFANFAAPEEAAAAVRHLKAALAGS